MDKKELQMLAHLRTNGRMRLTIMSKKIHVPVSTLYDKLKQFQKGLIKKHTALIDFKKLGFHTKSRTMIKVDKHDRNSVKLYLSNHPNINSVYKINNGYDFLIEGIFRHIRDVEDFLEKLDQKFNIKEEKTYYVVDEIKEEGFLSNPDLLLVVM